jgi:hypothetical protein
VNVNGSRKPVIVFVLVLIVAVALVTIFVNSNNKKIASKYADTLSQSCAIMQPVFSDLYTDISSDELSYSEMLVKTRQSERELATAKRILDYGMLEINSISFNTFGAYSNWMMYSWDTNSLQRAIDAATSDSIDIAIAQGDIESIEDGRAEEGLEILKRRTSNVNSVCNEYVSK